MLTKEEVAEQLRSMQAKIAAQDAIICTLEDSKREYVDNYDREKATATDIRNVLLRELGKVRMECPHSFVADMFLLPIRGSASVSCAICGLHGSMRY